MCKDELGTLPSPQVHPDASELNWTMFSEVKTSAVLQIEEAEVINTPRPNMRTHSHINVLHTLCFSH